MIWNVWSPIWLATIYLKEKLKYKKKSVMKMNWKYTNSKDIVTNFIKFCYLLWTEYICGAFNTFPDFFLQAFKIVADTWKFSMLLLYTLWDDWLIFMISGSKEQLQQQLEYILLKPDCHSWWISKMQSRREDNLEERYAIKFRWKLGKNGTETYGMFQTAFRPSYINRA